MQFYHAKPQRRQEGVCCLIPLTNPFSKKTPSALFQADATTELEITPAMVDAGVSRLWELLQAQVGLSYVATEVYSVMKAKS